MAPEIIVGGLSLFGTLAGTFGGIMASNRLVIYRLEQLEKKQDKYNNVIERTYKLEERMTVVETEVKDIKSDIDDGK